jgi:UDP-N-acetylmuramoylalanine--D-glutamate ligase
MGLGSNGGGVAAARFFAAHGAKVTATDLRSAESLSSSIAERSGFDFSYTLGEHRESDFRNADLVIKNPAVSADSPFLAMSREVETDISIFLAFSRSPVLAVTGSKGKSTVVSALSHILRPAYPKVKLGGNITRSPLSFLDELMADGEEKDIPVILELSSWQLSDLKGKGLLKPRVSAVTNLLHDHQNFYHDMETYAADKAEIFSSQGPEDKTLTYYDDPWGRRFFIQTPAQPFFFSHESLPQICDGGYLLPAGSASGGGFRQKGTEIPILPPALSVRGEHMRLNLLCAASIAFLYGCDPDIIRRQAGSFAGIEHRLEEVAIVRGVMFVNDSAATIPDAAAAGLSSFTEPVILIAGGADKNLDFTGLADTARKAKGVVLLAGSATAKLSESLRAAGVSFSGPFTSFPEAVSAAFASAAAGDVVLLSPGCASFGMFQNEFERGKRFREIVQGLKGAV